MRREYSVSVSFFFFYQPVLCCTGASFFFFSVIGFFSYFVVGWFCSSPRPPAGETTVSSPLHQLKGGNHDHGEGRQRAVESGSAAAAGAGTEQLLSLLCILILNINLCRPLTPNYHPHAALRGLPPPHLLPDAGDVGCARNKRFAGGSQLEVVARRL